MTKRDFYTPFLIGLSDGLVVPFAFMAGLSNILPVSSDIVPIIAGIAIFSAVLMSFGGYFTIKNESLESSPDVEKRHQHVKSFYANIGLPEEMQEQAVKEILGDREVFENVSHDEKLTVNHAGQSALIIGISYLLAALSSLLPLFLVEDPHKAFKISAAITIPALFIASFIRHQLKGASPLPGAIQHTLIGIIAGAGGYVVGLII